MTETRLVVSDIDGTLLNSSHEITDKTKKIVKKLDEKGIEVALASARAPKAMDYLAHQLALQTPLVCFNGALIVQKEQDQLNTLYSLALEQRDALLLYQTIRAKFPDVCFNVYSNHHWFVEQEDFWTKQEAAISQVTPEVISLEKYLKENYPVHKVLCMGAPSEIDRLQVEIESLNITGVAVNKSKDTYLEIVQQQVSKLTALRFLTKQRALSLSNTLAIGDNYNDMPMIQHAGIGIAMGNSPREVKQVADLVAPANDQNGFYHGINESLRIIS